MDSNTAVARGPFALVGVSHVDNGWEISTQSPGSLTLYDLSRTAKWVVRSASDGATAASLPATWTTARADGELWIAAAPGEWLVVLTSGRTPRLTAQRAEATSVIDVTHGRAMLRLTGESAPDLLARICAVPLSLDAFPNNSATRSWLAGVVSDVVRDDVDGSPSYILHCERSAARSWLAHILESGDDLGVTFAGDWTDGP